MRLNVVFHHIVKSEKQLINKFTVTGDYFYQLQNKLGLLGSLLNPLIDDVHLYFDDGYDSFDTFVFPHIPSIKYRNYTLAITTDELDKPRHLDVSLLRKYHRLGINIVSHGVSHVALAAPAAFEVSWSGAVNPTGEAENTRSPQPKRRQTFL